MTDPSPAVPGATTSETRVAGAVLAVGLLVIASSPFFGDRVWYFLGAGVVMMWAVCAWAGFIAYRRRLPGVASGVRSKPTETLDGSKSSLRGRMAVTGLAVGNLILLGSLPFSGSAIEGVRIGGGALLLVSIVCARIWRAR